MINDVVKISVLISLIIKTLICLFSSISSASVSLQRSGDIIRPIREHYTIDAIQLMSGEERKHLMTKFRVTKTYNFFVIMIFL